MRRVFGIVLIGLGVFGVVMAFVLPFVVVPASSKTPLNLDITQRSSGPAKLLNAATGQLEDATLRATRIVRTDTSKSDDNNTTVNETLCIVRVVGKTPDCVPKTDKRLLSFTTDVVTANRKNGESVHVAKWNENVNGTPVRHVGLSYKFPIDTKKKTYQFYLPDLQKAFPARYAGTVTVHGLTTYKFISSTGRQHYLGDTQQPFLVGGLLAGYLTDIRTVFVEPHTGTIVDGVERQVQQLADPSGAPQNPPALDTTLSFEDSAINYQVDYASNKIDQLRLAGVWAPLVLGVLGLVALFFGARLLRRPQPPRADTGNAAHSSAPQGPPPTRDPLVRG